MSTSLSLLQLVSEIRAMHWFAVNTPLTVQNYKVHGVHLKCIDHEHTFIFLWVFRYE